MYKKIFFDANIILDIFDSTRVRYMESSKIYRYLLDKEISLFTSCDIITTLYYIDVKKYKEKTLDKIIDINKTLKVIDFSNKEVAQTCTLMKENKKYKDLEDTMQYILAKKENCDLIISNDANFYADDIEIMSSKEFLKKVS
jgi:predicted nucleic acid-binding protein